jgi:hypothetical protein
MVKILQSTVLFLPVLCSLIGIIVPLNVFAKLGDFETTRLKSTSGAGVASVLVDEATLLNPAPLSFFEVSSMYIQKMDGESVGSVDNRDRKQMSFIVSDAKKNVGGSISYNKLSEAGNEKSMIAGSMSTPIGKSSAMGMTYRLVTTSTEKDGQTVEEKYKQMVFGVSHVVSEGIMLGMVLVDPTKVKPEETRLIVGTQFVYKGFISLLADVGSDYNENLSEKLTYKLGMQFKVMSDFYLRAGTFSDKGNSEKGNSAGIAWVGPKLVADMAVKNTTLIEDLKLTQENEKIKEVSFSVAYHF